MSKERFPLRPTQSSHQQAWAALNLRSEALFYLTSGDRKLLAEAPSKSPLSFPPLNVFFARRLVFTHALNGAWDEGEEFQDALNGVWDEGEEFIDELNGVFEER